MSEPTIHLMSIVAESVLEDRLVRDVAAMQVSGWTVTPCSGATRDEGHAGGAADIEGGNIRLDVLIDEDSLELLWDRLDADYFATYALVAWSHPVRVRRDRKFDRR